MASIFPSRRSSFSPVTSSYAIRFQPATVSVASPSATPFVTRIRGWQTSPPQLSPLAPPHPPPYDLPISLIDSFFRDVATKNTANTSLERGECFSLTLTNVPPSALPYAERRLDYLASGPISSAKSGKLDYNLATKTLIITCPSVAHEYMSRIDVELVGIINANNLEFYGPVHRDNPAMRIVSTGSAGVPLIFAPGLSRQPDGSLRILGHQFPFMVWEILDHMPLSDMPRKVKEYFAGTRGRVRIVMIIKIERQKPPKKRKRETENDEDAPRANAPMYTDHEAIALVENTDIPGRAAEADHGDENPELPSPPPPVGSLIRGVFWVYGCQLTPTAGSTSNSKIIALQDEQEFYPRCPTTSLRLSWADVLSGAEVPIELADRVLEIPYTFLYDRFSMMVETQHVKPVVQWETDMVFDLAEDLPGMAHPEMSDSDPSERSGEEGEEDGDPTFRGRAGSAGRGTERVTRLRVSQAGGL